MIDSSNHDPGTTRITGTVVGLYRYPVSSLQGERLGTATIDSDGVAGDRRFGLFDRETGAHIYPSRDARWNAAPQLFARLSTFGVDLSEDGESWASADDPSMLARVKEAFGLAVDLRAYGDGAAPRYRLAPIHLLSCQSLAALRRLLPHSKIDERRFRPNILVDLPGSSDDIPEYALLGVEFTVGGLRMRGTTPCGRCGFTTLETGDLPEDPAVLRTLVRQFERNFGIYCEIIEGGEVRCGDSITGAAKGSSIDPVVIVGGGRAGATIARALRRLGYPGRIRLYGAERHLPYDRPPLSKRLGAPEGVQLVEVLSANEAERLGITVCLNTPVDALDVAHHRIETADGTQISFGTLVLATGGIARRIPDVDRGYGRVHVLRTVEDAKRLSEIVAPSTNLFVFGGGWTGMEVAAAARIAGAKVTLFSRTALLAQRILPPTVGHHLAEMHRAEGVTLRLGFEPRFRETATGVSCSIGSERLVADHLVIAIGIVPADGLARRAGIACADGVVTDADGATERPGIYAIGDVAHRPGPRIESWHNANLQADRAARRILGLDPIPADPPRFWSEQYHRRLQIVGFPDPSAPLVSEGDGPFWDFGTFAIGLDAPERIHRFAHRATEPRSHATVVAPSVGTLEEHPVCRAAAVAEGTLVRIDHPVAGALAITRQQGRLYATADPCPHEVASLSTGFVDGGRIVCPLHFAEFDLEDGAPHHAPEGCGRLAVYPVSERAGEIYVSVPAAGRA